MKASKKPVRRLVVIYGLCLLATALAAVVVGIIGNRHESLPDPYRNEQRSAVAFELYYPSRLPEGYEIDAASLGRVESEVVSITLRNKQRQEIVISQQKASPSVNLDTLYNSFTSRHTQDLPLGKLTIGKINNDTTKLASQVAGTTWILAQAPAGITNETIIEVFEGLRISQEPAT